MSSQSPPSPPGVVVVVTGACVVAVVPIEIETIATELLESQDGLKSLAYKQINVCILYYHSYYLSRFLLPR